MSDFEITESIEYELEENETIDPSNPVWYPVRKTVTRTESPGLDRAEKITGEILEIRGGGGHSASTVGIAAAIGCAVGALCVHFL